MKRSVHSRRSLLVLTNSGKLRVNPDRDPFLTNANRVKHVIVKA